MGSRYNPNSQYGPQPGHAFPPRQDMSLIGSEMRIYMTEMINFQNEIRRLKFEIDGLKAWKEREMAGIPTEWLPPSLQPALLPPPPSAPEPDQMTAVDEIARPAWRTVQKKPAKKSNKQMQQQRTISRGPASPPPPAATPPPRAFDISSWAQWKPNPVYSPAPLRATSVLPLPGGGAAGVGGPRAGLFGPPSPGPG
ncbi:hypothetical protein E1B28_005371 [Marasmius oreades]|uniref:Uncharacterized protein n=1 Tax=Marasmius oreades TaxID=181124 RepID=A0A9P7S4X5_9AGAR|nr:uncharacterized protein E1B28_005371 [Marasmius oreades]KAG7094543.1 hypothetical protein E1B28_005371 [Marasmius oreades]